MGADKWDGTFLHLQLSLLALPAMSVLFGVSCSSFVDASLGLCGPVAHIGGGLLSERWQLPEAS